MRLVLFAVSSDASEKIKYFTSAWRAANRLQLSRVGRPDTLTVNEKLYLRAMRDAVR